MSMCESVHLRQSNHHEDMDNSQCVTIQEDHEEVDMSLGVNLQDSDQEVDDTADVNVEDQEEPSAIPGHQEQTVSSTATIGPQKRQHVPLVFVRTWGRILRNFGR